MLPGEGFQVTVQGEGPQAAQRCLCIEGTVRPMLLGVCRTGFERGETCPGSRELQTQREFQKFAAGSLEPSAEYRSAHAWGKPSAAGEERQCWEALGGTVPGVTESQEHRAPPPVKLGGSSLAVHGAWEGQSPGRGRIRPGIKAARVSAGKAETRGFRRTKLFISNLNVTQNHAQVYLKSTKILSARQGKIHYVRHRIKTKKGQACQEAGKRSLK